MIKGAFIFAAGLAVGTAYGFGYGIRLSKAFESVVDKMDAPRPTVVHGSVTSEPVMDGAASA